MGGGGGGGGATPKEWGKYFCLFWTVEIVFEESTLLKV